MYIYIHVLGQMTKADGRPNKKPHVTSTNNIKGKEAGSQTSSSYTYSCANP